MNVSVIIPTFNEAGHIGQLIRYLHENNDGSIAEIIVSDGGSADDTVAIAREAGATVIDSPKKGRAAQLNHGAHIAIGDLFYFVHADSRPPGSFLSDLQGAIQKGYNLGRYKTRFDSDRAILKVNAWFTRFDLFVCMGGDQTFFIKRNIFETCGGYNEDMLIMEDYEFCVRARKIAKYKIMEGEALISSRKYLRNSWLRVLLANLKIIRMYKNGASQLEMTDMYKKMLS